MNSITVPAYAKINLTLDVLRIRPDGYHDIRSIMQTVSLHDTLKVICTPDRPGVVMAVTGDEAKGVPDDASNIVHRAAVRLQKTAAARGILPGNRSGLHITLTKQIPAQAGLGGGSSDAAAALRAINRLFGMDLPLAHLTEIGASLGADVPFFLTGGTALVEGLGETVTSLSPLVPPGWAVIVKPACGVSTAGAYAALDSIPGRRPGNTTDAWPKSPTSSQSLPFGNDFQEVVLTTHPEIAVAYATVKRGMTAGVGPLLSGSGSAIFALVPDETSARRLSDYVSGAQVGQVWVAEFQGRSE